MVGAQGGHRCFPYTAFTPNIGNSHKTAAYYIEAHLETNCIPFMVMFDIIWCRFRSPGKPLQQTYTSVYSTSRCQATAAQSLHATRFHLYSLLQKKMFSITFGSPPLGSSTMSRIASSRFSSKRTVSGKCPIIRRYLPRVYLSYTVGPLSSSSS